MRASLGILALAVVCCGGKQIGDGAADGMGSAPIDKAPSQGPPPSAPGSGGPDAGAMPPVAGPGALALQVAVGSGHSCALIANGTVRCWGSNAYHEIGTVAAQLSNPLPMEVTGLRQVSSIAAGGYHTCALGTDRSVACWGSNKNGQLGDGTTSDSETPRRVVGLSDVVEISAGSLHTCARLADGTMRCWGLNHQGQLGDGRTMVEAQTTPVVVRGLAGAVAISAGDLLTCAVLDDGTARCWGNDCEGQVGDGVAISNCSRPLAVAVANLRSVSSISAGEQNACATTSDGRAYCWGDGWKRTAELVVGLERVDSIAAGAAYCALDRDGAVWTWGDNQSGELGDGTKIPRKTPAIVPGLTNVKQLSYGGQLNACALLQSGHVFCWGRNDRGQVGDGTTVERHSPSPVAL